MKYTLSTTETLLLHGITLHRIIYADGTLGGWLENEKNLSQEGGCMVLSESKVFGNAKVYENAQVFGNAKIFENAEVFGNAKVSGSAQIYGNTVISGNAEIAGF